MSTPASGGTVTRGRRKVRTGVVASDKMQKTVTVTLTGLGVGRLFNPGLPMVLREWISPNRITH